MPHTQRHSPRRLKRKSGGGLNLMEDNFSGLPAQRVFGRLKQVELEGQRTIQCKLCGQRLQRQFHRSSIHVHLRVALIGHLLGEEGRPRTRLRKIIVDCGYYMFYILVTRVTMNVTRGKAIYE